VRLPKKTKVAGLNDDRPVALTPIAMEPGEFAHDTHKQHYARILGPTPNRSVEDAISLTLPTALEHLDRKDTYVRRCLLTSAMHSTPSFPPS